MNLKIRNKEDLIALFAIAEIFPLASFIVDLRYGRKTLKDFTVFHWIALIAFIGAIIYLVYEIRH